MVELRIIHIVSLRGTVDQCLMKSFQAHNSKLDYMTFNCDIDIESAWLRHSSAHYFTEVNILSKVNENRPNGKGDMKRIQN